MIIRDVTLDEASLTRFLGAFNTRVRGNALIRPVFAAVIRELDWPRHMATIQASWSPVSVQDRPVQMQVLWQPCHPG
jgi:hemoglobin